MDMYQHYRKKSFFCHFFNIVRFYWLVSIGFYWLVSIGCLLFGALPPN